MNTAIVVLSDVHERHADVSFINDVILQLHSHILRQIAVVYLTDVSFFSRN